ncbi:MAG TPA: transcriptional regulator [Firmicutes bacterium]|nr:transcriptional regulator [Bacillota bacterium]
MTNWDRNKKALLQKRYRILNQAGGVRQSGLSSFRESITDLSLVDNHPADLGSENFERGKDLALQEQQLSHLRQIEEALARIDAGRYGICLRCGQKIPPARLKVIPEAPLCVGCQDFEERRLKGSGRPVEEEMLLPPFAQDGLPGDPGMDQEDFWQEVARHNKRRRMFEDGLEDEETGLVEGVDQLTNRQHRDQTAD